MITAGMADPANYSRQKESILSNIELNVAFGVSMVQLREKQLTAKSLLDLTQAALAITRQSDTKLLVNDRFDIALAAGADGVHLTSSSIPPAVVRPLIGDELLMGVSCHTAADVNEAAKSGASFAVYGPVFQTPGKEGVTGLEELSQVCKNNVGFPIAALGGLSPSNCLKAVAAGAMGIAGIRAFSNPEQATALYEAISSSNE